MNTINKFFFLILMVAGFAITGCVDNDFDEPENTLSIDPTTVISISEVLALVPNSGGIVLGEGNIGLEPRYIKGTVTADDASGNFYKTLTFQDATGALSISADRNEINAEFPEGNIAYVKLQGLTLGKDNKLPRLGYGVDGNFLVRIPDLLINDFLIPGGVGEVIEPTVISINDLLTNSPAYLNKLVKFENVEFTNQYVSQTYADANNPDGPQTLNTVIADCDGNEIILRNSGFADFASDIIPFQNGELTVIASIYGDDLQVFIRDTDDVNFTNERCDGSGGGPATNELTIQSIQDRFYDLGADKAEDGFISGTVISDRTTGQVNAQNIVIQNGEDGILVRFSGPHTYDLGTQLKITVSGQEVSEFRGLLQVNNVPNFNAEVIGNGALPQPYEITVDDLLLDNNRYESTRVLIKGATLTSDAGTWNGNVIVDDGTESISIFTFSTTSYANQSVPSGTVDVIAVVSQYEETPQLLINDPSTDVSGGTVDPGGDSLIDEGFVGDYKVPVQLTGWMNIATKGTRQWYYADYNDENFAECEGYQDTSPETEAWLVTPSIDTDEASKFSFETQKAFWQHQGLSVWISPDFTDFSDAVWQEINDATLADNSVDDFEWVASGELELKDYLGGKVRVAFKYEGTESSNTTKVRLDNVVLK